MNDAPRIEELLVVGRRVRIHLSGECDVFGEAQSLRTGQSLGERTGHPDWQNGRTGRIDRDPFPAAPDGNDYGHPIAVLFDVPYVSKEGRYRGGHFAPSELIPLADDGSEILHPALARFER